MRTFLLAVFVSFFAVTCFTQVAVRDEPRHHNVFENDFVRVLDVHVEPGDTTEYHLHATPSVFIPFTATKTASQILGEQPLPGNISVPGAAWYDSLLVPRIHRVWNEDTSWFHVIDVELTAGKPRSNLKPIQDTAFQLLYNKPLVNLYRLTIHQGLTVLFPETPNGYLLVSTGDAIVTCQVNGAARVRIMKAGHYTWMQGKSMPSLFNQIKLPATFLLLQLK